MAGLEGSDTLLQQLVFPSPFLLSVSDEKDERHVGVPLPGSERASAINFQQVLVEDDQIGLVFPDQGWDERAIERNKDRMPFSLQRITETFGKLFVCVNHQDSHG